MSPDVKRAIRIAAEGTPAIGAVKKYIGMTPEGMRGWATAI
jgi:hypothetical protein